MNITTAMCEYNKEKKAFSCVLDSIPKEINLKSNKTGKVIKFTLSHRNEIETKGFYTCEYGFELDVLKKEEHIRTVMFTYDIPDASELGNPSKILRKIGFRANLSCWVIPLSFIPEDLLELYKANQINYWIVKFDESEEAKIRARAKVELEKEVSRIHGSLIKQIASADELLKKVMEQETVTEIQQSGVKTKRNQKISMAIKNSSEALDDAIKCATLFDEDMNMQHLFDGLRVVIESRKALFNLEKRKE